MTREEALDELNVIYERLSHPEDCEQGVYSFRDGDYLEALDMAIKALEQEPCEDAISREQAIKECYPILIDGESFDVVQVETLMGVPSVQPKAKVGHWIKISPAGIYECSECGQNIMTSDICAYKFCHGCGAKMEEEKDVRESN